MNQGLVEPGLLEMSDKRGEVGKTGCQKHVFDVRQLGRFSKQRQVFVC
jgi:hypothetical protein